MTMNEQPEAEEPAHGGQVVHDPGLSSCPLCQRRWKRHRQPLQLVVQVAGGCRSRPRWCPWTRSTGAGTSRTASTTPRPMANSPRASSPRGLEFGDRPVDHRLGHQRDHDRRAPMPMPAKKNITMNRGAVGAAGSRAAATSRRTSAAWPWSRRPHGYESLEGRVRCGGRTDAHRTSAATDSQPVFRPTGGCGCVHTLLS